MDELIFFVIIGLIFISLGLALILKYRNIVRNLYNNRRNFSDLFRNIRTPSDRSISDKEELHGKQICFFIGFICIPFGLIAIFSKIIF